MIYLSAKSYQLVHLFSWKMIKSFHTSPPSAGWAEPTWTSPTSLAATAGAETMRPPTPTTRTRPDPGMSSSLSLSTISSALGSQDPLTRPWRGSEMMICFTMSTIKRTLTIIKEQEMIMILIRVNTTKFYLDLIRPNNCNF